MAVEHQLTIPPGRSLPRHIAIIMDGNNRWAKERRLPGLAGHKAGVKSVRAVIECCVEQGVEALTLFAFSSENWKRPAVEVSGLMQLFMLALKNEVRKLARHNIRLQVIGDLSRFSPELQQLIHKAQAETAGNTGLTLNIAANYGGRWDIVSAAQQLARRCAEGRLKPEEIDEALFAQHLSLADLPAPDLCIRTGGEQRVSNFLIWQLAYTELYFTDCFWPDFDKQAMLAALQSYLTRERRFGRTSEQVEADNQC
jgi:undecaprenyl diphosphate synthase